MFGVALAVEGPTEKVQSRECWPMPGLVEAFDLILKHQGAWPSRRAVMVGIEQVKKISSFLPTISSHNTLLPSHCIQFVVTVPTNLELCE